VYIDTCQQGADEEDKQMGAIEISVEKLGAVKLERPKSGDRLIRYRLHSGSEASGDSRIVIAA
jgi:hypothetical protein